MTIRDKLRLIKAAEARNRKRIAEHKKNTRWVKAGVRERAGANRPSRQ